ncbi:type II toxin-antitoxin system Phd/YefM family antitoxin [Acidicapsa dinghuensis]|uniref:Antitoxin n=1 Tax=Acidicapsa dinghuensis TaxID=2218256 RepID=A0ABW1EF91_9BACT|nr:type II toxin-antitoxin system prevent-host-death family antitoxin [Acidicapsa dinghuensis]
MPTEIGSFMAKTKFSEILRKVEHGERFTITHRGRAVARLEPVEEVRISEEERAAALERLRNPTIPGVPTDTLLEWIREGRK